MVGILLCFWDDLVSGANCWFQGGYLVSFGCSFMLKAWTFMFTLELHAAVVVGNDSKAKRRWRESRNRIRQNWMRDLIFDLEWRFVLCGGCCWSIYSFFKDLASYYYIALFSVQNVSLLVYVRLRGRQSSQRIAFGKIPTLFHNSYSWLAIGQLQD